MKRSAKGVTAYLILAFGLAWALWEIPIRLGIPVQSTVSQFAFLPGAFAPAIAAIVVRKWVTKEGFADAGLQLNLRKLPYYLIAWLLPFGVIAFIVGAVSTLGVARPDFTLQTGLAALHTNTSHLPTAVVHNLLLVASAQLAVTAILTTPILWGEEFGWRGYLQLRLFPSRPLLAAIATGVIWSVWHLPLNLRGYNFPGDPISGMVVFTVGTILLSIVFGWLRTQTDSIWAPSLAHAAVNNVGASLSLLLLPNADRLLVSILGVFAWLPLGLLCAWIVGTGQLQPRVKPTAAT